MGADDERIRVLVVDDHAVVRSGLLAFLEGESDLEVVVTAAIRAAHRGELQLDPAVARRLMSTLQEPRGVSAELTARELDVAALIGEGKANKEIALQLGIGERTARTHVSNILRKLGLTSRTQLALWAVREQLVNVEP